MKFLYLFLFLFTTTIHSQQKEYNTKNGVLANGYDVVAYFSNKAVKGNKELSTKYEGVSFLFSSQKNLQLFQKNPVKYIPQYGGYFNDLTLYDNLKAISEIVIDNKVYRSERINYLISKFELDNLKDIKAKFLSGGQKKKLVIALSLLSEPKVLLLDECFAALDVLTIKMLQEIIVNLQQENKITICICDHQARDLLACVDVAMILNNGNIIAQDTPSNLVKNISAKNAYFGESFKFN